MRLFQGSQFTSSSFKHTVCSSFGCFVQTQQPTVVRVCTTTCTDTNTPLRFIMGVQKRLDGFFTVSSSGGTGKRIKTSATTTTTDGSGNENSDRDQVQRPVPKNIVDVNSIDTSSEEAVAKARQEHRALANRNHALAKQAVIRCEQNGTVPMLGDLLVEESWRQVLGSEFEKGYFKSLEKYVRQEWTSGQLVFPPKDCIFRAFNSCPLGRVRVVILGQDPYHDIGQAQGLSFSVPRGKQLPSSLRNIYKEISEDVGCRMSKNGCLEPWTHQVCVFVSK